MRTLRNTKNELLKILILWELEGYLSSNDKIDLDDLVLATEVLIYIKIEIKHTIKPIFTCFVKSTI